MGDQLEAVYAGGFEELRAGLARLGLEGWIEAALRDPSLAGLAGTDLAGLPPERARELTEGEALATIARVAGSAAHRLLMRAQWGYGSPDWFDHRHHVLEPEVEGTDYWAMSADNVIGVLPFGGRLLDLCAGDAWYDFHFWRKRASEIVCVDVGAGPYRQYLRLHQAPSITYHLADVLTWEAPAGVFDVCVIRGAIEHFSQAQQQAIFQKAAATLKPDGWFCGDTPAAREVGGKMLAAHDCEWANAEQARGELACVFKDVEVQALVSKQRTTLFWRARGARA